MGHGVIDETDPLFVPLGLAHEMWADVDLVLGIGTRIEFPLLQWGVDRARPDPDQHRRRRARPPRASVRWASTATLPRSCRCWSNVWPIGTDPTGGPSSARSSLDVLRRHRPPRAATVVSGGDQRGAARRRDHRRGRDATDLRRPLRLPVPPAADVPVDRLRRHARARAPLSASGPRPAHPTAPS